MLCLSLVLSPNIIGFTNSVWVSFGSLEELNVSSMGLELSSTLYCGFVFSVSFKGGRGMSVFSLIPRSSLDFVSSSFSLCLLANWMKT